MSKREREVSAVCVCVCVDDAALIKAYGVSHMTRNALCLCHVFVSSYKLPVHIYPLPLYPWQQCVIQAGGATGTAWPMDWDLACVSWTVI